MRVTPIAEVPVPSESTTKIARYPARYVMHTILFSAHLFVLPLRLPCTAGRGSSGPGRLTDLAVHQSRALGS